MNMQLPSINVRPRTAKELIIQSVSLEYKYFYEFLKRMRNNDNRIILDSLSYTRNKRRYVSKVLLDAINCNPTTAHNGLQCRIMHVEENEFIKNDNTFVIVPVGHYPKYITFKTDEPAHIDFTFNGKIIN